MKTINPILALSLSCALLTPLFSLANDVANSPAEKHFQPTSPVAIDWQPCPTDANPNLLCAKYPVPLDYKAKKRNRKVIEIALIKSPANDITQKPLGSLFINPGGPGGSGVDFVRDVGDRLFSQAVRDRYDLIGFDPRGVNLSNPITCGLTAEQLDQIAPPLAFPSTRSEERQQIRSDRAISAICANNGNEIMHYMTTANVARDLDVLRQAVGDELLHYVGYSYGSYLGVTYANLFPQKVGRLVVDGVLDPIAWSTGWYWSSWFVPVTTRLESDKHSMATLQEFFRLCDLAGPDSCSVAPNSAARFHQLAQRLKSSPQLIHLPDGSALELTYSLFIAATANALYSSPHWSNFADLIAFVEAQFPPALIGQQYSHFRSELGIGDQDKLPDDHSHFAFPSVLCSDSDNPIQPEFWPLWAEESDLQNGYFGRFWTWRSSLCAHWPALKKGRFMGPFNKLTKNPVLVTSTLFDPATPYSGAQVVASLLPNSRLLTVSGWGHPAVGLSACADQLTDNYLLTGALPAHGTVCEQSVPPFQISEPPKLFSRSAPSIEQQGSQQTANDAASKARVRSAIIRSNSRAMYR